MNRRCLNRDGDNPAYARIELRIGKAEFIAWALPYYEQIIAAGKIPTVSRIGDKGHYEIGNIEIIPKDEHRRLEALIRKSRTRPEPGKKVCPKCRVTKECSEFSHNRSSMDGRNCWCKLCVRRLYKERLIVGVV